MAIFEFVLTGRHVTRRCDGDSVEGAAFGGPIFYGHAAESFDEPADHKGNVYWYQAKRTNELFQALDGKQRKAALLGKSRGEHGKDTVKLSGKATDLAGIPVSDLSVDQKELAEVVVASSPHGGGWKPPLRYRAAPVFRGRSPRTDSAYPLQHALAATRHWEGFETNGQVRHQCDLSFKETDFSFAQLTSHVAEGPDTMTALIEADLFETISELLAEQHAISGDERREGERRNYECIQLLAPYDANRLPRQEDFRQVQCRDLSPRGFSFLSYRQPATEHVIVALGAVPFKFFVAKIIHSNPSENELSQDYLVGCRFVRRLTEDGK